MVGCSRLPGSHGTVAWQKRGIARTIRSRCKHMVHLIHARASHRGRLGLYLRSVRSRAERVRYGVEEVDVLVAVVEEVVVHVETVVVHVFVDVHVDGSGTRDVGVLVGPVLAV